MSPSSTPRRVLVVDDQRDLADTLAKLIEALGHEVRTAYDAATAWSIARKFRPEMVFTDIAMPGESGLTLVQCLRSDPHLAECRIVALSGYTESLFGAHSGEVDDWVVKPIGLETLERLLAKCR